VTLAEYLAAGFVLVAVHQMTPPVDVTPQQVENAPVGSPEAQWSINYLDRELYLQKGSELVMCVTSLVNAPNRAYCKPLQ
jgi:hypothetical protein